MSAPPENQYVGWTIINANLLAIIRQSSLVQTNNIFDYAPANFNGYPAVVLTQDEEMGVAIDTVRNKYVFKFHVMVFQTRLNLSADQNTSYEDAETLMRALVDDLTVRLNTDITVGGLTSAWSRPVSNKWGFIKDQDVNTRTCDITIEVVVGQ